LLGCAKYVRQLYEIIEMLSVMFSYYYSVFGPKKGISWFFCSQDRNLSFHLFLSTSDLFFCRNQYTLEMYWFLVQYAKIQNIYPSFNRDVPCLFCFVTFHFNFLCCFWSCVSISHGMWLIGAECEFEIE